MGVVTVGYLFLGMPPGMLGLSSGLLQLLIELKIWAKTKALNASVVTTLR